MRAAPLLFLLFATVCPPLLAQPTQASPSATAVAGSTPWSSLTAEQKSALQPLASQWPTLSQDHQRKWVALTHNFNRLSEDEQATLQGRMSEWAQLSPAQRNQARMNFHEVRRVPADEKRAKWEEYQALPAQERERLAGDRPKPPAGVAPALPSPPGNRVLRAGAPGTVRGVATSPGTLSPATPVNSNTLLPQAPSSAASLSR